MQAHFRTKVTFDTPDMSLRCVLIEYFYLAGPQATTEGARIGAVLYRGIRALRWGGELQEARQEAARDTAHQGGVAVRKENGQVRGCRGGGGGGG